MPSLFRKFQNAKASGTKRKAKPLRLSDGSVPEWIIQRNILDWLKQSGLLHWRQNSGVVFAGNRRILLGEEGLPDIIVVVPPNGKFLGLEVKSARGCLRPAQRLFRDKVTSCGGLFMVVRTLAEAQYAVAESLGLEQWKAMQSSLGINVIPDLSS